MDLKANIIAAWNSVFGSRKSPWDASDINAENAPWKREFLDAARRFNRLPKAEQDALRNDQLHASRILYNGYLAEPFDALLAADAAHVPQFLLEAGHAGCEGMKILMGNYPDNLWGDVSRHECEVGEHELDMRAAFGFGPPPPRIQSPASSFRA